MRHFQEDENLLIKISDTELVSVPITRRKYLISLFRLMIRLPAVCSLVFHCKEVIELHNGEIKL